MYTNISQKRLLYIYCKWINVSTEKKQFPLALSLFLVWSELRRYCRVSEEWKCEVSIVKGEGKTTKIRKWKNKLRFKERLSESHITDNNNTLFYSHHLNVVFIIKPSLPCTFTSTSLQNFALASSLL